ncbi:MAG: electron transfer flavoprotein subunit beta [Aliifodinibius sp.]|nr:electron transfer flavoprotein subunit beta/FixA family protein [Fodinibius sp.]NIY27410.1 electron transfer flavoprotein subunit beta [Fodinibius sp.]
MKILVIVSQTQDTEAKIQVSASGDSIETGDMKWIMNPYDEFAVEEAIQTKEKHGGEVVIISIGPARVVETIRQALAMGADSAVHINGDNFADTDSFATGAIIASEIKKLGEFDVIFTGMKIIDEESGQVGVQIAEELGIPHVSLVSKVVEINADAKKAVCQKEIDGGHVVVEVPLPCLITCPDAMNEPRYASLPGIMKAKKKPLTEVGIGDISFDGLGFGQDAVSKEGARVKTTAIEVPQIERKLKIIKGSDEPMVKGDEIAKSAEELIKLLREDAKVI